MQLHVGINCKKGATIENKGAGVKYIYLCIYYMYLSIEVRYREKISFRIGTAEYITTSPYNKQNDAFWANKSKLASQETSQR